MAGSAPLYAAPANLNFMAAFEKVPLRVHLGLHHDETAELCQWHAPEAHYLEAWGDVRSFDGTVSLIQPLIAPMFDAHSLIELVAVLSGSGGQTAMQLVKAYWTKAFAGQTKPVWTIRDSDGGTYKDAETFWRNTLHDGFIASTSMLNGAAVPVPSAPAAAALAAPASMTGTEIIFRPDPYILDGRNANNGWLQEMPKPLSKVAWDNIAYISARTAERLNIPIVRHGNREQDVLRVTYQGRTAEMPVWVLPGTADDVVVVHFGYGRRRAGRIGTNVGSDVFGLRTSRAPWFDGGAEIATAGRSYLVVSTQNHFSMEDRHPVRV